MDSAQLKAAGFSDTEIAEYERLQSAGFTDKEITDYYAKKASPVPETPDWKQTIAKYGPAVAKTAGLIGGGALGAAGGPVGMAAGGALGTLGAGKAENVLESLLGIRNVTPSQDIKQTLQEVPGAVSAGMAGPAIGAAASRAAGVGRIAGKSFLAKLLGLKTEEKLPSMEELGRILGGTTAIPRPPFEKLPGEGEPVLPTPQIPAKPIPPRPVPGTPSMPEMTPPTSQSKLERIFAGRAKIVPGINQGEVIPTIPPKPNIKWPYTPVTRDVTPDLEAARGASEPIKYGPTRPATTPTVGPGTGVAKLIPPEILPEDLAGLEPSTAAQSTRLEQLISEYKQAGGQGAPLSPKLAGRYEVTPESQLQDLEDILYRPAIPLSMKETLASRLSQYAPKAAPLVKKLPLTK